MGMGSGWIMPSGTHPATQHVPEASVPKHEGDSWTCGPLTHPFVHSQACKASLRPPRQAHIHVTLMLGSPTSSNLGIDSPETPCRR